MGVALPVVSVPHYGWQIQWQISCDKEGMLNTAISQKNQQAMLLDKDSKMLFVAILLGTWKMFKGGLGILFCLCQVLQGLFHDS